MKGARLALRAARVTVASYLALWGLAWAMSDRIAFQPPRVPGKMPEGLGSLDVGGGVRLATLAVDRPGAQYTLLFHHGNAEDLSDLAGFLEELSGRSGASVLAYDYRGYGRSGGAPGETSAYADAALLHRHLVEARGVPAERIVIHGRSLGGAIAADLASRVPAAGLILESTFVSAAQVLAPHRLFPFEPLPTGRKVARVACPTLHLHGRRDAVVAPWHAEALQRASSGRSTRLVLFDGAGHDDLADVAGEAYFAAIRAFLESLRG